MSILMGKKILVVDNAFGARESIRIILKKIGAFVITAEDAEDALVILKNNSFDLTTTDLRMPGMNGIDLCLEIKDRGITTPIIIISGFNSNLTDNILYKTGTADYITKPFNENDLIVRVERALLVPLKVCT